VIERLDADGRGYVESSGRPPGITRSDNRQAEEQTMSGETDKASGRIKQAAGDLTDNDDLKREGRKDETAGKVKDTIDSAKDKLDDAVDKVKEKMR
jgi:uncharacterized protein YjbJ (UPF0337 family)